MGKGAAKPTGWLDVHVTQLRARLRQPPHHHSPTLSHAVTPRERGDEPPKNPKSPSQPRASLQSRKSESSDLTSV